MVSSAVADVLIGIYLGLLAGLFPGFVAFSIGFGFRYFTNVTVPGLGVVVLGGTLAGISGGLMGLADPQLAESATGVTAVLVVLMACLWAHGQGDKLAAVTPRKLTLRSLGGRTLSADLVERVDSYGQVRIRPVGGIADIEGYPPLPDELREQLDDSTWKFPVNLPLSELETRLEERLLTEYELAEAVVHIDERGLAQIAAAPSVAGLSRRVPPGERAVTIRSLLPAGMARGDVVTVALPDEPVTGPVVSARTDGDTRLDPLSRRPETEDATDGSDAPAHPSAPKAPTTTGGEGAVTLTLPQQDAKRVIRTEFAPTFVHSRGQRREYEVIDLLERHGNRFQTVTVGEASTLAGTTIGAARLRDEYGVAIFAIRRSSERIVAPDGATELRAGDVLLTVGERNAVRRFEEAVT